VKTVVSMIRQSMIRDMKGEEIPAKSVLDSGTSG